MTVSVGVKSRKDKGWQASGREAKSRHINRPIPSSFLKYPSAQIPDRGFLLHDDLQDLRMSSASGESRLFCAVDFDALTLSVGQVTAEQAGAIGRRFASPRRARPYRFFHRRSSRRKQAGCMGNVA